MSGRLFALLVHDRPEPFESLKNILKDLSVETYSIATCKEAGRLISQCKPHMVFTDTAVTDGSWVDVFNLAEATNTRPSVIVVWTYPDTRRQLSVGEPGAYGSVVPPFEREPLSFVVRSHRASEEGVGILRCRMVKAHTHSLTYFSSPTARPYVGNRVCGSFT